MSDERPSRAYVLGVYIKRLLRWQRTSYPYLSGDAFAKLADFRLNPVTLRVSERNLVGISDAEIIFCKGEELEPMFRTHPRINAKVIICGNSDYEFHSVPRGVPASVRALFLQNSFISDNQLIFTLPIGIENLRWGVNGHPKLLKKISPRSPNESILFGPFGETHPLRKDVINEFTKDSGPWKVLPSKRMSAKSYSNIAKKFRYVAAVRGNGIDTHRLWESLYRGIWPIVQNDSWSKSFDGLCLPILKVEKWNTTSLIQDFEFFPKTFFNPADYDALWMPFWESKIRSFLD